MNLNDGSSQTFDNNGNTYPMSDAVVLQQPQSCLLQGVGSLTVAALVRNDILDLPVNLGISYLTPRTGTDNPVPALNEATVAMTAGDCVGQYTFYSASYTIPGGLSFNARISVTAGEGETVYTDDFNKASDLSGTCGTFTGGATCADVTIPTATPSVPGSTSATVPVTTTGSTTVPVTTTDSTTSPTGEPTPEIKPTVGGYVFVDCWTEGAGERALNGPAFAYDEMTLESCMGNCTGFDYWGTEYGRECYCGNSLAGSSTEAPVEECNMVCGGDPTEFCGAGNRLELYSTTATRTATATTTPTPTSGPAIKPTVGDYTFVGCQTESTTGRALSGKAVLADDTMTLELCADYCSGFTFFGTEYGRECYCGDSLGAGSASAPPTECNMPCAGDATAFCGAGNRLELYRLSTVSSTTPSNPPSTAPPTGTPTPPPTPSHIPSIPPSFALLGCYTEGVGARALSAKTFASADEMTLEACAAFCEGHRFFGTEYSAECYCGDALHATAVEAAGGLGECGMVCSGDGGQYCGGPDRLSVYESDEAVPPPSGGGGSGPSQPGEVADSWAWEGCFTEGSGGRALSATAWADDGMTLEGCAVFCEGYEFFGAEYGRECYCGNGFGEGAVEVDGGECAMACAGDASQLCGSGNRLSVYSKGG